MVTKKFGKNSKSHCVTNLQNSICDKTQNWNSDISKAQIVRQKKTQKLKLWQNWIRQKYTSLKWNFSKFQKLESNSFFRFLKTYSLKLSKKYIHDSPHMTGAARKAVQPIFVQKERKKRLKTFKVILISV